MSLTTKIETHPLGPNVFVYSTDPTDDGAAVGAQPGDLLAYTNSGVLAIVKANHDSVVIATSTGSTPSGSDTEVQFNDGGAFGGDAGLVFNKTSNKLTVGDILISGLTASKPVVTDASKNLSSATTTGSGSSVLATSPTLVTPVLGVATGTSLAATAGLTSSGPTGAGIGYATGAGGTVTQATDRVTGVTLSKLSGIITTHNASLAALAAATFTVTNTTVAIGDVVIVSQRSGATNVKTDVRVTATAAGSFNITVHNIDASTAETGAIIINVAVIKAVSA